MELTLDQAFQKGIDAHKAGNAQEADRYYTAILKANPKHPDANHNMGVLAVGVGKVEAALTFFKTALEVNPKIEQFWLSYINALIRLDHIADAKAVFDQATSKGMKGNEFAQIEKQLGSLTFNNSNNQAPSQAKLQNLVYLYSKGQVKQVLTEASELLLKFPSSVDLYNITGAANRGLGKLEEAIQAYKKAISIKPDYAGTYNNMGNALQDQGKLEEAIEAYTKALSLKPDYAEVSNNMGVTLLEQGKLDEAIEAYKKALSTKPDYAEAYYNLGNAIKEQGRLEEAIKLYNKALSIKPDFAEAYYNIGILLESIIFNQPNRDLQKTLVSLLGRKKYARPRDLAKAAISLLKLEPTLQKHLQLVDTEIIENPTDVISDLSELPLLLKLMSVCPLPDLELEKLLKNLRSSILANVSSLKGQAAELLVFQSALALQCFTNEYIYSTTEEEEKARLALEKVVKKAFKNNEKPSSQVILALASYKPLDQYDWCNLLVVTDHIKEVFCRQVEEPNQEEKLKQELPVLEEITDSISSEVRAQYEQSPYPRWVNLGLPLKPMPVSNVVDEIKLKLHNKKIEEVEEPEILIAGCGTGQHSIETASRFKFSKVLAIDLSLSSLAYAKRKTDELGVENIEYMQADILDLNNLNKEFDIIESAGVLHHMDNPMAGWRVLTDCLKPGGLMKIGLYSELARQHIVKMRQEISAAGIGSSHSAMRSFRTMVMTSDQNHHQRILNSLDFYSLSTLKDLLFHVQEHRFTIPQIQDCLFELGLKFCGFEYAQMVSNFKETNTNKDDPYDLDKWQAYEEANPRAFAGMYQFWCLKVD